MKKKLLIALLAIAAAICCAFGFAACGESDNGTYYLFVEDQYVMSEYVTIDGKNWSDSNGMSGKVEIKDGTAYFYMDFFGQETLWQQGKIGGGKLELQGLSGPMTYYKEGKAHIHSLSDWQVTKEPTCTAAGQKMRVCSCGLKETETLPALGHDVDKSVKLTSPATCQADGSIYNICERCGEKFVIEVLQRKPNNHYIDKGKDTSVCSGCGIKLADSLEFGLYGQKSMCLTHGEGVNVIVPAVYADKPVVLVDREAFKGCTKLESITIPEGISFAGDVFLGCTNIKTAILDSEELRFSGIPKQNLQTIVITSGKYISNDMMSDCTSLKSITINNIGRIDEDAFANLTSLESVTLNNVSHIASRAFDNCVNLKTVDLKNVTSIGGAMFSGCTSLESIEIPDSITSIDGNAFESCTAEIIWGDNPSIQEIGDFAFSGYKGTSITIPDSVTSISNYAFDDCTELIQTQGGVQYVDKWVIGCDTSVSEVNLRADTKGIANSAFEDCTSLESVTIPDGVTYIGDSAFEDCTSLESVTIPDSVTSIGYNAFEYCSKLIQTQDGVQYVDKWVVGCNYSLTTASLRADTKGIMNSFSGYSLESIIIPDSVTFISRNAFYLCSSLKSIVVSEKNEKYSSQDGVLYNKDKTEVIRVPLAKTSVVIPNSVTSIGENAFYRCRSLESITIPNSVISIGSGAFAYCTSLESVTIPDSVTSIGEEAFDYCESLESITIGDGVTSIGDEAFGYCASLESITIGDGVTSIGGMAFWGCDSLESVTIPSSVTSIGISAFSVCKNLESVTFENTNGWEVSEYSNMASTVGADVTDDAAHNAMLLRDTYGSYYWHRY